MSIYLPLASVQMKRDSSVSRSELIRKVLTAKIPTLTLVNVFLEVDVLTLRLLLKMLRHLPQNSPVWEMMVELQLLPVKVQKVTNKSYFRPCCVFRNGTALRNARGAVMEVYYLDLDSFYTCDYGPN